MSKTQILPIKNLYCLQAAVGSTELSMNQAAIFRNATPKEILTMTKRDPLKVYPADFDKGRYHFLDDGTHRLYIIRYHSQNPDSNLQVHTKLFRNNPYPTKLLEEIIRNNKTIENIGYRI